MFKQLLRKLALERIAEPPRYFESIRTIHQVGVGSITDCGRAPMWCTNVGRGDFSVPEWFAVEPLQRSLLSD
jgi:hypothetical protein